MFASIARAASNVARVVRRNTVLTFAFPADAWDTLNGAESVGLVRRPAECLPDGADLGAFLPYEAPAPCAETDRVAA